MNQQHKTLKNKIKLMIFFIISCCCLIPVIFISFLKVDAKTNWLEENKVSLTTRLDMQSDTLNYAKGTITIYVATRLSESNDANYSAIRVPVHIRTRDYTALGNTKNEISSSKHDYEKIDEVIYLSNRKGDILYQTVTTTVYKDKYAVGEAAYFYIEIADVLSEHFSINNDHKQIRVSIDTENWFSTGVVNGYTVFDEYLLNEKYTDDWDTGEIVDKEGQTFYHTLDLYDPNKHYRYSTLAEAYKARYYDLASLYVGSQAYLCESAYHLSSYFDIKIYDSSSTLLYKGSYRGMENGDGSLTVFGRYVSDAEQKDLWYKSSPYAFLNESGDNREKNVYLKTTDGKIQVGYTNNSNYYRRIHNWQLSWILVDTTAPEVVHVGYNQGAYKANDKIDVGLKFSEPVQVRGALGNVKLKAKTTGTGDFDNRNIELVCTKAGNSNTVIFTYDPSGLNGSISEIEITGFVNGSNIVDYGRNIDNANNSFHGDVSKMYRWHKHLTNINYNNTTPSFTIDDANQQDIDSKTIKNSHNVTLTTPSMNNELYGVYYVWSKDQVLDYDLAKRYEFINSINSSEDIEERLATLPEDLRNLYNESKDLNIVFVPKNSFKFNLQIESTLEGETGDYYFHVLAKNIFETKDFGKTYGPFRIDNTPPVISNIQLGSGSSNSTKNINFEISDYSLSLNDGSLENIKNIILYASESPLNDLNEAKRILVYGQANASLYDIDGTQGDNSVAFQANIINGKYVVTISLDCIKHLGFSESGKESGIYFIGLSAVDSLDNKLELEKYDEILPFDIRDTIKAKVYDNETLLTDDLINGCYVIDMAASNTAKVIKLQNEALSMKGYRYELSSITRFENNATSTNIDINDNAYFENYVLGDEVNTLVFNTKASSNPCGYYEIKSNIVNKTNESEKQYIETIRLYIVDSSKEPLTKNYDNIYNNYNALKNNVFFLNETEYFYASSSGISLTQFGSEYYNGIEETLVFSSKEKALDYVKRMEYQDLYPFVVNASDIINIKNDVVSGVPEEGQIWIRYKVASWSENNHAWAYYPSTLETTAIDVSDLENISSSVYAAVNKVSETIVNNGRVTYLTKEKGYLAENGMPFIAKAQIPNEADFNQTKKSTSLSNNVYLFDFELYSDDVLDAKLATYYNFSYLPFTKIFYAPYGSSNFIPFFGSDLYSVIEESGKYTIKEYDGEGLRTFNVYIDKNVPNLAVKYVDIKNTEETQDTLSLKNNGDFIHSKEFSITGFTDDIDNYSYLIIYDITNPNNVIVENFYYAEDFSEITLSNDKIHKILVSDRSGNVYTFKVSVTDKELNTDINIIDNDKIVVTIKNRDVNTISTFIANINGVEKDYEVSQVGNDCQIEFIQAGEYEFSIADLYGYSLKTTSSLTRAKISENANLVWYEKIGNSFVVLEDVSTTDGINFYVRSDKRLYLKLDSATIYGYETTGKVSVELVNENDTVYLKTESNQFDRWSLKLYYLEFPDNYAVYSRIDEKGSSWLNDYEVSLSASLIEYDGEVDAVLNDQIKLYVATKVPGLGGTEFDKVSDLKIGAHIKTVNYSAIAGIDYDSIDENFYLTSKDYEVLYQTFYINVRALKWGVDGNNAYFYVKLADVLAEGFSINQAHSQIKITIATQNRFTSQSAYGTSMLDEYLTADRISTGWDTGKIEDKEGKKFWNYFNYKEYSGSTAKSFNNLVDKGLAVLYVESDTNMDEKWVKLTSTLDLAFYDNNSKGTQLFSGSYTTLNETKVYFKVSVSGSAKESSADFASSPNSFLDTTENYDRTKGYYVRVPSKQLAVSYVNGSNYFRRIYDWYNTWIVIDETAPFITGWYIDKTKYNCYI